MNSIRARVRRVFGLALAFCWICGGGVVVAYTASNENSLWDGKLQSFGTRLLLSLPAEKINEGPFGPGLELRPELQGDPENFALQVWSNDRRLVLRSPSAPLTPFQPTFRNGFATLKAGGQTWRVYTISDRDSQVSLQVANLQSVIDREMVGETLFALAMMTAVLVLVALLLGHALNRSLRPLSDVERALRQRKDFDLTPLPVAALPVELQPLVTSFNHLLLQLDDAVAAERRFLGDAAHELRTPLSVLQAHVDVAVHARTDGERQQALTMLQQGVRRSARLAEQLLDMARLDAVSCSIRTGALDLTLLVEHVMHEYAYHAQSLGCRLDADTAPAQVEGNLDELATLLRNLLDNAVRFARGGGRVQVACGVGPEGPWLRVADDGPGVPEAERMAIFQRFYRLPGNQGRGSGIGLSLVAAIARLHDARIETGEGLAGKGFAVRLVFPAVRTRTDSPA